MAGCALIAGIAGYCLASSGVISLSEQYSSRIDPRKHANFLADGFAHNASYLVAIVGGVLMVRRVWRSRRPDPAHEISDSEAA